MKKIILSLLAGMLLTNMSLQTNSCLTTMLAAGLSTGLAVNTFDKRYIKPNFYGALLSTSAYVLVDLFKSDCSHNQSPYNKLFALGAGYLIGACGGKYINAKLRYLLNKV
jgi:hypothetical protein